MKKLTVILICFLMIFTGGCGTGGDIPESVSIESITTESLSLLDQMIRSDAYFSLYTNITDQYSSILGEVRSVSDLTKPAAVYSIKVNEEKLMPLVFRDDPELPADLKKYTEEKVNMSISSLINSQKGTDYLVVHTACTAKSSGFCHEVKEGAVILNVYETGYPVLSVVHPVSDGYVEVTSTVLFIDATSQNSKAEIEEMFSSYRFIESVNKK